MEILAIIITTLFFLLGVIGSMVPVIPGAPLIWLGMLLYGLIAGFDRLSLGFFAGQGALALAVMGVDYLASGLGARYFGGTRAAFWGAMAGLLVGLFFFPLGLLVGPFAGAVLVELLFARRRAEEAVRSGAGAFLGFWGGLPVKLALEGAMIAWFIVRII